MRLKVATYVGWFALTSVFIPIIIVTFLADESATAVAAAIAFCAALLGWKAAVIRFGTWRFSLAFMRDDARRARGWLTEINGSLAGPFARAACALHESAVLILEERYADACTVLQVVEREPYPPVVRALVLNNLAYATALAGRPVDAVPLADAARAMYPGNANARTRALLTGTLGIAHVLAGDAEPGAALIVEALAAGGRSFDQAQRAFFLGDALRALGREKEAKEAYARAVREAPRSKWGLRAAAKAAVPEAPPFR
jgi:hypothetical protein